MAFLPLSKLSLAEKKALLRVDFNVPLKKDGTIADLTRIVESLPTIKFLLENRASIILMSHLGRPKGEKNEKYSLRRCQEALSKLLNKEILFANDAIGPETQDLVKKLKPGEILLLENLRFHPAEENPSLDLSFAKTLASYGDVYINDAFAACHRNHSSITYLAKNFPHLASPGFLLEKEIQILNSLFTAPSRPFHAIIGGAKVSSKLGTIRSLLDKVDCLYIGGAMAFTFFKGLGLSIGNSLFEPDLVPSAMDLLKECREKKISVFLPKDIIITDSFSNPSSKKTVDVKKGIDPGWFGMDIGPETISEWKISLQTAQTIFWNGPVGVFETPPFSEGTFSLIRLLANFESDRVIGGGDTAAAIHQLMLDKNFTHISTGGGATLEFIEHGTLPGIEALSY